MTQTLVKQKQILTSGDFYKEILDPSVNVILIGEDHFDKTHKDNEYKIIEKAMPRRKGLVFLTENFSTHLTKYFEKAHEDKTKIEGLYRRLKKLDREYFDNFDWPSLKLCLSNGIPVLPLEIPGNYDLSRAKVLEREKHISKGVARNYDKSKLIIGIFGNLNLRDGVPHRNLDSSAKRKEVYQLTKENSLERQILKKSKDVYTISQRLR